MPSRLASPQTPQDYPMPDDQGSPAARPAAALSGAPPSGLDQEPARRGSLRGRLFTVLGLAILIVAVCWAVYYLLVLAHYVSTDDAYVGRGRGAGHAAGLRPGGWSVSRRGDPAGTKQGRGARSSLDPADAKLAVAQARSGAIRPGRAPRVRQAIWPPTRRLAGQVDGPRGGRARGPRRRRRPARGPATWSATADRASKRRQSAEPPRARCRARS